MTAHMVELPNPYEPPPNPWLRISDIAAMVGVEPAAGPSPATIVLLGADGNWYDVWDVVEAVLNRLDQATAPQSCDLTNAPPVPREHFATVATLIRSGQVEAPRIAELMTDLEFAAFMQATGS